MGEDFATVVEAEHTDENGMADGNDARTARNSNKRGFFPICTQIALLRNTEESARVFFSFFLRIF